MWGRMKMMMMKERMTPKPKTKTSNQKGEMCGGELPLPNYS